jgi:hypothetical protein
LRVEFFGDDIERITRFEPLTGEKIESLDAVTIYPGKQFVTPAEKLRPALLAIREELSDRIAWFEKEGKLLEAQRIKMRTEWRAGSPAHGLAHCSIFSPKITCWSLMSRMQPCPKSAGCMKAIAREKLSW